MSEPLRIDRAPERPEDAGRRERALESLLELGRELTVTVDLFETADLLLFNLMGQLGAGRSAIWLVPGDQKSALPALVRAHGFRRPVLDAIGSACAPALLERFREDRAPTLAWALREELGAAEFELVRHAEIALLAPLHAGGEILGWLALGPRVDGSAYGEADLRVLEAALGIVAVSLLNARLYNRVRETNRRLRASNEHLSELDRLKSQFLNNVNHELRTPLTLVLGSLELVAGAPDVDPQLLGLIESSLQQSKKLQGMIENLLTFSDASNARLDMHLVRDDVSSVLDECFEERLPGVSDGLRELVYRRASELPAARFDRQRLAQILDEILDNAVKFTPRGSRIEIRADHCGEEGQDWIAIEVSDDGPGIPPERIDDLFDSFRQLDGSMTRHVGGMGLGLAFAHKLAECMGARLTARSSPGEGCVFRLRLPLA
jgi:signal transduction histidine kinase